MVELAATAALAYLGGVVAGLAGVRRPAARLALALPLGVATYVIALLVLLVVGVPVPPLVALAVPVGAVTVVGARRGLDHLGWGAGAAIVHGFLMVVVRLGAFPRVSADSFRYVEAGSILRDFRSLEALTGPLALTRQFTYPAVQALAAPGGYVRTFSALALVSAVAIVLVAARDGLGDATPPWTVALLVFVAVLTPNRVAYHALYLNGHTLFAALLLIVAAAAWIAWKQPSAAGRWWLPATLATAALVPLRPEAVLVAGFALLPWVVAPAVPLAWRRAPMIALGATTILWYGGGPLRLELAAGRDPNSSVVLAVVLGVAALAATVLTPLWQLSWTFVRRVVVAGLIAGTLGMALLRTDQVLASVRATAENLTGAGYWGWFWPVVVVLLAVGWHRRPEAWDILLWPIATFPLLGLVVAIAREKPYRVGPGDSFSRMLMHLLPVVALALLTRFEQPVDPEPSDAAAAAAEDPVTAGTAPPRPGP
jgi:hypothetical protein